MIAVPIFGVFLFLGGYLLHRFLAMDATEKMFCQLLMIAGVVFIFLPLLYGCSLKSQQIAHVGIQSADVASGVHAVARGGTEINPLMQTNLPTQIALKSVQTAGVIWITRELAKRGHEKLSKGLLYALNAAMVGIVVNNWRVAQ